MFEKCFEKLIPEVASVTSKEDASALTKLLGRQFERMWLEVGKEHPEMTERQQAEEAAKRLMEERVARAEKNKENLLLNAVKLDGLRKDTASPEILNANLSQDFTTKTQKVSQEAGAAFLYAKYKTRMQAIAKVIGAKNLGFLQHVENATIFMKLLYGEDVPHASPELRKAAEDWRKISSELRDRANAAGAYIRDNPMWHIPQKWDQEKILRYTKLEFVADFFNAAKDKAGRIIDAYNKKVGYIMNDAELKEYLGNAYDTLRNNRGRDTHYASKTIDMLSGERSLFIKDADSWMALNDKYGKGGVVSMMDNHIMRNSQLIALTKIFGPDAAANVKKLSSEMVQLKKDAPMKDFEHAQKMERLMQYEVDEITGMHEDVHLSGAAGWVKNIRSLASLKLGSAIFASMGDNSTALRMNTLWGNSNMEYYHNIVKQMSDHTGSKFILDNASLAAHQANQTLYTSARDFAQRNAMQGISGIQMKMSLLPLWTEVQHSAFRTALSHSITKLVDRHATLGELKGFDGDALRSYGMTEHDWKIMQMAEKVDAFGIDKIITNNTIAAVPHERVMKELGLDEQGAKDAIDAAEQKLLGSIYMESKLAIVEPTLHTKATMSAFLNGAIHSKTFGGELAQCFIQFKSFPIAFFENHWARSQALNTSSRAYHMAAMITSLTMFGALAKQVQNLSTGKTLQPMANDPHAWQFWGSAFMKGGALGVYGDFLFSDQSYGKGVLETMAGPVYGDLGSIIHGLYQAAFNDHDFDKKLTDLGGNLTRTLKTYIPGANLWYTRALLDHYIFLNLQDMLSPGYSDRMQRTLEKQKSQTMWWAPHDNPQLNSQIYDRALGG